MTTSGVAQSADQAGTAGERLMVEAFLDAQRAALVERVRGVSEAAARLRLVSSRTTLAGLLRHSTIVERNWFQYGLAGRPRPQEAGVGRDQGWQVGPEETVAGLIAEYEVVCGQSRQVAAQFGLDEVMSHHSLGAVSLRWIYLHMVEELARHAGHADILREQLDAGAGTGSV